MALFIASINSGSNGNCYYIGNEQDAVLVDAGISCREIERRMKRLELSMEKVRAILISHEHSDHIKGVEVLSRKYRLPVYITTPTLLYSRLKIDPSLTFSFKAFAPIRIHTFFIHAFP
ncbi:MAG TPA: MBL fold metallo-hydrolase, partial [Bacteroidia bacterium]|nr:MBL fold metallo-hydrolase [Bacteroidia bacterium]